jgi:hypothetical protein
LPGDTPGGLYASRYIYVLFQATYTRWPVTVLRGFYNSPAAVTYDESSWIINEPLYAPGTYYTATADHERRDRLLAAYKETMRGNEYFRGEFPVYIARVRLEQENAPVTTRYLFVPSIDGEPSYAPGSALAYSAGGGTSPMGEYMNRIATMVNNIAFGEPFDFTYE